MLLDERVSRANETGYVEQSAKTISGDAGNKREAEELSTWNEEFRGEKAVPDSVAQSGMTVISERSGVFEKADGQSSEQIAAAENIDYDRITKAASQRPVVVYVDRKAAAVLLSRDMDTAIGNRNIRQLVSMGG